VEQQFEVIAEGLAFPEGPVVLPDGSIVVMEMMAGRVTRAWGGGRTEVVAEPGGGPNGAQLGPDGALYVCNNGGGWSGEYGGGRIERVDLASGLVERLYDSVDGNLLGAPNDMVVDAEGGIWFTDYGHTRARDVGMSGIYYCRADGREICEAQFGGLGYNGIGLSPDGRTVYVASTSTARLCRFEVTGPGILAQGEGMRGGERLVGHAPGESAFDSLAVTASGAVCVATVIEGGVATYRPDGERSYIPMPDSFVTNIAFGGGDMRDAYLTFSETGRLVKMRWAEPGLKLNFS
jgi:gluconolactonase